MLETILNNFHLIKNTPELISCPTCGRTSYDMLPIIQEMEEYLKLLGKLNLRMGERADLVTEVVYGIPVERKDIKK